VSNLESYRASERERARTEDLLRVLPRHRYSVLDIGARDGYFSRLLTDYFVEVTALDLEKPGFEIPRVATGAGDATNLDFPDNAFDCVFCAEVLEHIPDVHRACREIVRVARHEIVIVVPYKQDIRLGRTTCPFCRRMNPPWGHVNSFDERRLLAMFSGLRVVSKSFVGTNRERTNPVSALLMGLAGNPWGTYEQDEPCRHCGRRLSAPKSRQKWQKVCSGVASRMSSAQSRFVRPHGNWIHLVFSKATTK
jgi:SAM-dependent methyltransferase